MFFSIGLRKGLVGGRLGWARRGREHSEDWEHWEDSVSAAGSTGRARSTR